MITPDEIEVIEAAIESDRLDLHTFQVGSVQAVHGAYVDVRLGVKRLIPTDEGGLEEEEICVLKNLPVWCYRDATFHASFPVQVGTEGAVLFAETSLAQWRAGSGSEVPDDVGRHTLTGGVFFPGVVRDNDADALTRPNNGITIGTVDGTVSVSVQADGTITAENNAGSFDLASTGRFSANGSNFTVDP
jgi:hypothetical protein